MKGRIVRIDKTARQKGTPSWLNQLIYVDDAKNPAKPAREGGTRSDSLLKANATHPTTCDGGPKEIATYPSNSEGNVLNEPAETGEKNFDTCNGELEIAAESECDLAFFSLRKITEKTSSAVAKPLHRLFLGLMDRSMGETNFFIVTMMGLACSKVISAQFFEAEAFGELNLLAFLIAISTASVFTASKKLTANPLDALCISVLPAFIETAAICAVRGLNLSEEYALIMGFSLVCAVGGLFLGSARYLVDDADPNEALKRAIVGAIWGFAIGATAAIITETTPIITDALANRDIPTFLEQLLATH